MSEVQTKPREEVIFMHNVQLYVSLQDITLSGGWKVGNNPEYHNRRCQWIAGIVVSLENSLELILFQCAQPGVSGTAIPERDQERDHLGSSCESCQAPRAWGEQAQTGGAASPSLLWQVGIKPRKKHMGTHHTKTLEPGLGIRPWDWGGCACKVWKWRGMEESSVSRGYKGEKGLHLLAVRLIQREMSTVEGQASIPPLSSPPCTRGCVQKKAFAEVLDTLCHLFWVNGCKQQEKRLPRPLRNLLFPPKQC